MPSPPGRCRPARPQPLLGHSNGCSPLSRRGGSRASDCILKGLRRSDSFLRGTTGISVCGRAWGRPSPQAGARRPCPPATLRIVPMRCSVKRSPLDSVSVAAVSRITPHSPQSRQELCRKQRIPVADQVLLADQGAFRRVSEVGCHLTHPQPIRLPRQSCALHPPAFGHGLVRTLLRAFLFEFLKDLPLDVRPVVTGLHGILHSFVCFWVKRETGEINRTDIPGWDNF